MALQHDHIEDEATKLSRLAENLSQGYRQLADAPTAELAQDVAHAANLLALGTASLARGLADRNLAQTSIAVRAASALDAPGGLH